jgi:hypothetical protein
MSFAYMGAMFCQSGVANYASNFDYVVVNCGHHPASTSHFSYQRFRDDVGELMYQFAHKDVFKSKRVFWLENTAQPLRQDDFTFFYKDWRTYHRLMMFDAIAASVIDRVQAPVATLPAFHSTLALFDKMCDCGHYAVSAKIPQLMGLMDSIYDSSWSPSCAKSQTGCTDMIVKPSESKL